MDFVVFRCCGFWGFFDVAFGGVEMMLRKLWWWMMLWKLVTCCGSWVVVL